MQLQLLKQVVPPTHRPTPFHRIISGSKLELIDNRMKSQKTTFETLKSENEDIDVTETAIDLKSAEMTYEAALMATGKVMQTTLLNFI